jgi:hypothetical protein
MIARKLFDASCRIEGIWPIPNGEVPEAMLEAFEYGDHLADKLAPYVAGWDENEIGELFEGQGEPASTAWGELGCNLFNDGKQLFVVLAANPVFKRSKGGGCHFSWGHYQTEIFIAETVESAMEEAIQWAEARYEAASAAEVA